MLSLFGQNINNYLKACEYKHGNSPKCSQRMITIQYTKYGYCARFEWWHLDRWENDCKRVHKNIYQQGMELTSKSKIEIEKIHLLIKNCIE